MGFPDNTDLLPYMMESGEVGFPIPDPRPTCKICRIPGGQKTREEVGWTASLPEVTRAPFRTFAGEFTTLSEESKTLGIPHAYPTLRYVLES